MPHFSVSLYPGTTEAQKKQLAEGLRRLAVEVAGSPEAAVSVRIREVAPEDWTQEVYQKDIAHAGDELFIRPRY